MFQKKTLLKQGYTLARAFRQKALFSAIVFILVCIGSLAYAAGADDPFYSKQTYLQQIHMNEAWDVAKGNSYMTIAIVDTGVDLSHPDLKANLVQGTNLINPGQPPMDDNGHGTNVAGVIAAVGNNDRGVTGILWHARIMPIKALEADGSGGEAKLGEGIRYAVDQGAKIVVLSLGLNKYSDYMRDIVQYAEEHDVLLVSASGNEGKNVKYPAAYPTVLAVGGVSKDGKVDRRSNTGPEMDVVAPWEVFTTALGGSYEYKDGTSMAAPQAAAVAALAWSRYPNMKAYQIRQWIRQTAESLGGEGWNPQTGYGLIRADRMMKEEFSRDMYEPNNRKDQAKPLSISKSIAASFSGGDDSDWFYVDAPYNGTLKLSFQMDTNQTVDIQHTDASGVYTNITAQGGRAVPLKVTKGRSYIQLQLKDRKQIAEIVYRLTTSFDIYEDPYEDNDRQFKAYMLPMRSVTVKGTFHQTHDVDWFEYTVPQTGSLRIRLSTDTARMDPILLVQKQGGKSVVIDDGGDKEDESYFAAEVYPGNYYIRVSNVKEYANPIVGEYTLSIEYDAKFIDPNEPNNRSYQATAVSLDVPYNGLIDKQEDVDWFQFRVEEESLIQISVTDVPQSVIMYMNLYNGTMKNMATSMNSEHSNSQQLSGRFLPGTYYVKLTSNKPFDNQMYQFIVNAKPLVGGYTDIRGHWAQDVILKLSDRQWIDGYDNYTFQPERPITRAEATAILVRAFKLVKQKDVNYSDLPQSHWAYDDIAKARQAGIIEGYPDGTFAPDQPVTRMEMTAMLARSMNKAGKLRGGLPFIDVDANYWGTGLLKQVKAEGWIKGYSDGSFHPEQKATRAEFVQLLSNIPIK